MNDDLSKIHIGTIGNGNNNSEKFIEAVMKYLSEHSSSLDESLPNIDIPDVSKILSKRPLERKRKRVK